MSKPKEPQFEHHYPTPLQNDDAKERVQQQEMSALSTRHLACVLFGCKGNLCGDEYGHPNTADDNDRHKYYCQYAKACKFENASPGKCFNSHQYGWPADNAPKEYICQFWVKGKCNSTTEQCTMYHPEMEEVQIEGNQYSTKDISCPGCKRYTIACKEYYSNSCLYGHATKYDKVNGSKLFCEFGNGCRYKDKGCNRNHDFNAKVNTLKCPWEAGQGQCVNRYNQICPYFHDGQIGGNGLRKWKAGKSSYGQQAPQGFQ